MTKRQIMGKIPFKLLAVFLLLAAGISAGGFIFYKHQRASSVVHIQDDLNVIAQLKSEEITAWRRERYGDAYVLAESKIFASYVRRWFANPKDNELKQNIYKRLDAFRIYDPYKEIILLDTSGRVRLFAGQNKTESISRATKNLINQALGNNKVMFSDFYYCEKCREVHLDLALPLSDGQATVGTIVLRINPDKYLYPLIQTWPGKSKSGETLILRREGDEIVFLNELRHQRGAAMKLRLPLADTLLPAAMAAMGKEGMVEGRDYRGIPVVAAIKHIADSPWYMVAKVDKDEIYVPLKRQARNIVFITILAIMALAAVLSFIWQTDRRGFYKRQYQLELERQALVKHFDYLTKYANDIIFLIDDDLKITEINDRALEVYGYTRDEFIGMNADQLRADDQKALFKTQMNQLVVQKGLLYETVHKRKDGTTFPVEISARTIEIERKNYLQGIVRDITERKQYELKLRDRNEELEAANQELVAAEEELRYQMVELQRSKEEIANEKIWSDTLIQSAPNIVIGLGEKSKILLFNSYAEKLTGYKADEVLGKNWIDLFIPEELRTQIYGVWDEIIRNKHIEHQYESPMLTKNKETRLISWSNSFLTENGKFRMVLSLGQDITVRKKTEQQLTKSEAKLRTIFESVKDGIFVFDMNGNILEANKYACELHGYTYGELIGMPATKLVAPESHSQFAAYLQAAGAGKPFRTEARDMRKDGTFIEIEASGTAFDWGGELQLLGVVRDITERKRAEEELKKSQEQLKNANELAHIGSWNWAIETDTVAWTEELYRIAGLDPAFPAPTYAEHSNIYTPESWARLKTAVEKAMSTGERYQMELELIRPDGTTRWVNAFGGASKDGRGNIIGLFGTVQDITERKLAEEALKKNEEAKTKLLENLNAAQHIALIGSWEWDVKTDKVWWSDETYQIFGVTPQDYTPSFEKNGEFIHPDDLEIYKQSFAQSLKTGKPLDVDIRLIAKDGVLKQCSASGKIIQDDDGRPFRFIGTIMDITKRKRIDEALLETSRRLELTLTISKAGTWDWDVIAGNIKWSPEMYKLFELDPLKTTASFESWKMKLHPEDVQLAESRIEKALKGKTRLNSDYRVVLSNGQIRWINATGEGVYDEKGQPTQMLGICLDITERKEAEIKIIENEQKFRQLAESIDIVFWLTDWTEKKLLYVNQAYEKVFGFTVESAYSDRMGWKKAVHPDDLEWVSKELQRHAVKEEFTELKYRIICQGKMKWIHEQAFPLKDETGKVIRFINVADDITDRKQAEEHIQKQLAELQRWQNTMLDREDRVMELKREVNELLEKIGQKHKYTSMGGTK